MIHLSGASRCPLSSHTYLPATHPAPRQLPAWGATPFDSVSTDTPALGSLAHAGVFLRGRTQEDPHVPGRAPSQLQEPAGRERELVDMSQDGQVTVPCQGHRMEG